MNGLIRKVIKSLGMKWLTGQVRAAAEGEIGPRWHAVYWGIAGQKRWLSLAVGLLAAAFLATGYQTAAEWTAAVATFGLSLGWIDAKWRDTSDEDWLYDNAVWKFLARNSPTITAGLVAGLAWLHGTSCTWGEWCGYTAAAATILGAALVQVGLVDAAWNTPPPR